MKKHFLFAVIVFFIHFFNSLSASKLDEILPFFKQKIKEAQDHFKVPGFAIALIENGHIRFMEGFGFCRYGSDEPVTSKTIFQIGSVSKSVTATLIARLIAEGKLKYDNKIISYMPDFKYCDAEHSQNLTIRDVLSQRSGLPAYAGDDLIQAGKNYLDALTVLDEIKPIAPLGERYSYQNVLYCLSGMVVEKISRQTAEKIYLEKLFRPLGLERTSFGIEALKAATNVASSHQVGRINTKVLPWSEFGYRVPFAGGINMSIEDLAKYLALHINGGKIGSTAVIPEQILQELYKPHIITKGPDIARYRRNFFPKERVSIMAYGLGFRLYDWAGHKVVGHGGFVKGQLALITFLPEQKAGIAILTNGPSSLSSVLRSYFLDLYLDQPSIDWLKKAKDLKEKEIEEARTKQTKKNKKTQHTIKPQKKPLNYSQVKSKNSYKQK